MKFLEPVDDTVERIADVVFAIMLTAGTLSVAMGPVSALGAGMIALASALWLADRAVGARDPAVGLARRLLAYGAFLGVGLPLAVLISATMADHLTAATWAEHQTIIEEIMAEDDVMVLVHGYLAGGFAGKEKCITGPDDMPGLQTRAAGKAFEQMLAGAGASICGTTGAVGAAAAGGLGRASSGRRSALRAAAIRVSARCRPMPGMASNVSASASDSAAIDVVPS